MSIIKHIIREELKVALRLLLGLFPQEIRATFFIMGSLPEFSPVFLVASPFL